MHILIVEDEIPAFEKLRSHLTNVLKDDFTYDWARSVSEGVYFLKTDKVYTLIISDVQLLDGVSFEIFEQISINVPIIFCSAYDEYLFKAFKTNGIAYILKPYGKEDVNAAITKYKTLFRIAETSSVKPEVFNQLNDIIKIKVNSYKERFVIKSKKGIHLLAVSEISLIRAEGDFCKLIDFKGKTHLYSQNIGSIYSQLDPIKFFRINRSEVVQLQYIKNISNHFKNRLLIALDGIKDPVKTSSGTTSDFRVWLDA